MAGPPLDQILDATARFIVKTGFSRFDMPAKFGALRLIRPAQHDVVQFEQILVLALGENVDVPFDQDIDEGVPRQQVFDNRVAHRIVLPAQARVERFKLCLDPTQRGFDGR